MPVQKFHSFDEATRSLAVEPAEPDAIAARVASLRALSSALTPPLGFRGVRKYRSIEDANADHDRMTVARPVTGGTPPSASSNHAARLREPMDP
jgi:hypothetical protein